MQTEHNERITTILRLLMASVTALALSSCGTLATLGREVRAMDRDTTIIGRVDGPRGGKAKVFVLKRGEDGKDFTIADSASPNGMGDFVFVMPGKTPYYVAAIPDQRSGAGQIKEILPGKATDRNPLVLDLARKPDHDTSLTRELRKALGSWKGLPGTDSGSIRIACGDIASLDDRVFDPGASERGLWAPLTFAKSNGLGVYFLEPYDPRKIPVVFVHGIGGTPRSSEPLMRSLDRSRYQIWVYSYPSGVRLESAARGLAGLTDRLHSRYGFRKMHVVAHSMGGLVARRAVQMMAAEGEPRYVSSLTTLSTPWNGMPFATVGAVGLPHPIPCWLDMRPGSDFIRRILDDPMPVPHLLVSTDQARFSLLLPRRNDGTVSVASQQDPRAMAEAGAHLLVHRDHMGVLDAPETKRELSRFLRKAE